MGQHHPGGGYITRCRAAPHVTTVGSWTSRHQPGHRSLCNVAGEKTSGVTETCVQYLQDAALDWNNPAMFFGHFKLYCEAQGKGRAKGHSKVIYRWWMVDILSLMLYTKFGI